MSRFINTKFRSVVWASAMTLLSLPPVLAQAPARIAKNAVLQLVTGDDGKDDTDILTVTVADADGKLFERVFDAKEEIKPGTTFNLWLNRIRALPPEQVKGRRSASASTRSGTNIGWSRMPG